MVCQVEYEAQTANSLSLRQGDRIYVVERTNQDWWFVKKKITNQMGLVPANSVVDEVTYTHYINNSLDTALDGLSTTECKKCTFILFLDLANRFFQQRFIF